MMRLKFTIRLKLLLLSIAVLSIPYFGFEYLRELERYMQDALELSLTDAARAVAAPLNERADLFPDVDVNENSLYVHAFNHPIQLDGYGDDWLSYLSWSDTYTESPVRPAGQGDNLSFRIIVSQYQQYIYAFLQVKDRTIVYQRPGANTALDNDHVVLVCTNPAGQLQKYYFSPAAPGSISPFQFRKYTGEFNIKYQTAVFVNNINGVLQPTADGYNLELQIPKIMVGDRMGFIVADVDNAKTRQPVYQVGTAGKATAYKPSRLARSSPEIKKIIDKLTFVDGRRIWVLDKQGHVLSSAGSLDRKEKVEPTNLFYSLILPSVNERFSDDQAGISRLQGPEVLKALQGKPAINWQPAPGGHAVIISAAHPVWIDGKVRGAVVVEETTNNIQMIQRHATKSLLNKTIFVFTAVTLLLLAFATRLSFRLRRLSREAEHAIDEHGRVVADFSVSKDSDEIGELSRNYASMLDRLKQYNQYLEGMSGRLSHELRTPITVVQSSLDRLQVSETEGDRELYLGRASEGIERLNLIVIRLSEATRLEQALTSARKSSTDVCELLTNCLVGYRLAYPQTEFGLTVPDSPVIMDIAAELIVQMLDKLVDNAVGFSEPGKPVKVEWVNIAGNWQLRVTNYGPLLPATMEDQIFNSMVSLRDKKDRSEPHLGLGLYIVRLIAEFHGATVRAESDRNAKSVTFTVEFKDKC